MQFDDHPTVLQARANPAAPTVTEPLDTDWLRRLCLDAGADDVGFVSIERLELAEERPHILRAFPGTLTLISIATRLHRESIRAPARSIGNMEFHRNYHDINDVSHRIASALEAQGIAALNPAAGFPMEMDQFPGRIWVVSHKPVAVAAGIGRMGIHRSIIHPKWGSFINLATVLVARACSSETAPVDYNPCLSCKLCVAACPVGAIEPDGTFDFSACSTHNYRDFMTGFNDWVETIADAPSGKALRQTVPASEQASMWQSLSFGASYKAAYCIAVCPAGEDVIGPYLASKAAFKRDVLKPLTDKIEPLYVESGSDAEIYAGKRFPHKPLRRVASGLRPNNIESFLLGIRLTFRRNKAAGLAATYHFIFTGAEPRQATIRIENRTLSVAEGLLGHADLVVTTDSSAWVAFVRKDRGIVGLFASRKLRLRGSPRLLLAFGRCFP